LTSPIYIYIHTHTPDGSTFWGLGVKKGSKVTVFGSGGSKLPKLPKRGSKPPKRGSKPSKRGQNRQKGGGLGGPKSDGFGVPKTSENGSKPSKPSKPTPKMVKNSPTISL